MKKSAAKLSGKFVLRVSEKMHQDLKKEAQKLGISLNHYCISLLAKSGGSLPRENPYTEIVHDLTTKFGEHLIGILLFGSMARGEATANSDCDVLVVLERDFVIDRSAYHSFDARQFYVDGHEVQIHLVHLPNVEQEISGLFAELAIDGIIIQERNFILTNFFRRVRQLIAEGKLVRQISYGQPYWLHRQDETV